MQFYVNVSDSVDFYTNLSPQLLVNYAHIAAIKQKHFEIEYLVPPKL